MNRTAKRGAFLALVMGLIAALCVIFANTASAHTGDLKVTFVKCEPSTGLVTLEAKLTTGNVPAGNTGHSKWRVGTSTFQGTPTNANGMPNGPVTSVGNTTVSLGTFTVPGTTTGFGPWVYAFTNWTPDGATKGSDGQLLTKLPGACTKEDAKDADYAVTTTPATCDTQGSASVTSLVNATAPALDQTVGSHSSTATANQGHRFADNNNTKTVSYTIEPKDVSQHCFVQPPDEHQYRSNSTTPTCKVPSITTTNEQRDRSYVWDGTAYVPGAWSAWYVTSTSTQSVDVTKQCTVIKHVHINMKKGDFCNCFKDWVKFTHGPNVKVHTTHPTKLTWIAHATGRTVHLANGKTVRYLLPKFIHGSHGWAQKQTYTVSTTNVPCPCHKTHTCHHMTGPHPPHCPTPGKLNDAKPCHV